jgi:hypothetical protein
MTQHPIAALRQRAQDRLVTPIEPPFTDEAAEALRQRNAERVKAAIAQLGSRWVLNRSR